MTYLTFLLLFLGPPLLILLAIQPRPLAGLEGIRSRMALPATCLLAILYTTPWDNYLVYKEVWGYGADRIIGTIGYVPIEEYAFFLLQPLLTGLLLYYLLARHRSLPEVHAEGGAQARWTGVLCYAVLTALGLLFVTGRLAGPRGLYMGLILSWSGPVLLLLWLYAGPLFWKYRTAFLLSTTLSTLYLWVADAIAIRLGIWHIAERYTLGPSLFGLPLEEATFFLMTNLLVVQGVLLFLFGDQVRLPFRLRSGHR